MINLSFKRIELGSLLGLKTKIWLSQITNSIKTFEQNLITSKAVMLLLAFMSVSGVAMATDILGATKPKGGTVIKTCTPTNYTYNCGNQYATPGKTSEGAYFTFNMNGTYNESFSMSGGSWKEYSDGTARLTGLYTSNTDAQFQLLIDITFTGRTTTDNAHFSNDTYHCYPTDRSDWYYYTGGTGQLLGVNGTKTQGAVISISPQMSVQIGTGASGNSPTVYSLGTWLNLTIDTQPNNGNTIGIATENAFDLYLDMENCSGGCVPPTLTLGAINCTGGTSTPDKTDDAFNFALTVNGTGGASNLWEAVYNGNVIQTGAYGDTKTITVSYATYTTATSMLVTVRDKDNPTCSQTVTVQVPNCSPPACTGFAFTNYVVTCTGTGQYKICFNVTGTGGRKWAASLKTSNDYTVAGIPIASGTGDQTNICYTITASQFTTLQAFSPSHFILWGMLELADGTQISGTGCEIDYTVPYTVCCSVSPTVNSPAICRGESAVLTVSNCAGNVTWSDGGTGSPRTVSPISTKTYTATCTVGTCTGTATATVTVNAPPVVGLPDQTICAGQTITFGFQGQTGLTYVWSTGATTPTITVSPTITTNYIVTVTATASTCSTKDTAQVVVTPRPNAGADVVSCQSTIKLNAAGAGETWSFLSFNDPNNPTLTATASITQQGNVSGMTLSGFYRFLLTNSSDCSDTIRVQRRMLTLPNITLNPVCEGTTLTFGYTNTTNFTYLWSTGETTAKISVTPTQTTDYIVTATEIATGCTVKDTTTATIKPKPTITVVSKTCAADLKSYTVNVTVPSGTVVTSNAGIVSGSGTAFAVKVGADTTSFTILADLNGCKASLAVTKPNCSCPIINPPVGSSKTICSGDVIPALTVTVDAGLQADWYSSATSTTKLASGLSYTPTAGGDYYVEAINTTTGCKSATRTKVSLIVKPKPTLSITATSCSTDLTTYTVTFSSNGTVTADKGTVSGTTVTGIPTGQTVTLTADLNGCKTTATATKSCSCPTINPPVGTSKTICSGDVIPALTVTVDAGLQADWYSSATSTTKLASGLSYTPTAAGDYFVEAINTTSGCKSTTRTKVSLIINPKPTLSITATVCSADLTTYTVTFSSNGTVTADKGTVSGTTVTGIPTGQTVTLTADLNGCKATATATKSCSCPTINPPVGTSKTICSGDVIPALTVTVDAGLQADWYSSATSTTKLASGLSYTPTAAQYPLGGDFYVEAINTTSGCKSTTRTKVSLIVNPKPTLSITATTCSADLTTYTVTFSSNGTVSTDKGTVSGTTVIGIPTGQTVTLTADLNGCKTTATATKSCSCPTINPPVGTSKTICSGDAIPALTVTVDAGLQADWYSSATSTTKLASGLSYTPTAAGDYYVEAINTTSGCKSTTRTKVSLIVKPKPTLSIASTVCSADLTTYTVTFTSNGTVSTDKGTVSGTTVTGIPTGQTVTLTADLNGCKSTATATKSCSCPTINPPVGTSKTICLGDVIPALTVTLDAGLQADWYSSATSTTKLASGLSYTPTAAGDYYVEAINTTSGCKSTTRTKVSLIVNPKPILSTQVTCAANGLTYSVSVTTDAALISADKGTVTGMTVTGVPSGQTVTITATSASGCKATTTVTQNCTSPKGSIGDYVWKDANNDGIQQTTELPVKDVIVQLLQGTTVLATDTTDANGLYLFPNLSSGTYQVKILTNSLPAGCAISTMQNQGADDTKDSDFNPTTGLSQTVTIDAAGTGIAKDNMTIDGALYSPKGSIGDYVWKDANNDGIQQTTELPVKGVIVQLLQGTTVLATDTTDAAGLYLFPNLSSGSYQVKILTNSLPAGCAISTMQNQGTDDTKDSDFNPTTGLSQIVTIDATGTGITKDNITIDGALYTPCTKPVISSTSLPICTNANTYSFTFTTTGGNLKVNTGTVVSNGGGSYTVNGASSLISLVITDSTGVNCVTKYSVNPPVCNCTPDKPALVTPTATICIGDTFPTLKVTSLSLATNVVYDWYSVPTGGIKIATGSSYKPTGTATTNTVFYVEARTTRTDCQNQVSERVAININVQDCTKEIDLALKKLISSKTAKVGDNLVYTIKVWNESSLAATGVEVTDNLNFGVKYISSTATRGSYDPLTKKWTIGNIAAAGAPANGDTVTLNITVKVLAEGVWFNTAEITKANEKDIDSTPGNGVDGEDDIDRQCFSVPIKLCAGQIVSVSVPTNYTGITWFKGTQQIATGNTIELDKAGTYTFTATSGSCPAGGCCPIVIETVDCCPADICIPFTIKQTKKGGKKL